MNCYDCQLQGKTSPAVAVCTSCGSAVCADCVRAETLDRTSPATPGNPPHHTTRRMLCAGCDRALAIAA